jgi:hypothetical protein
VPAGRGRVDFLPKKIEGARSGVAKEILRGTRTCLPRPEENGEVGPEVLYAAGTRALHLGLTNQLLPIPERKRTLRGGRVSGGRESAGELGRVTG